MVKGGASFIGSALVRYLLGQTADHMVSVDKLTYAGNLEFTLHAVRRYWRGLEEDARQWFRFVHPVRAWHHTCGLALLITSCSNNYGPYPFPEKVIPSWP